MARFGFHRVLFFALIGCFVLDQITILASMTKIDLLLRPLMLLLLVVQGILWMKRGTARIPFLLISLGLLVAIPNEIYQRMYGFGAQSIVGTAIYYGLFFLGFATLRIVAYSWRIILPFLGLALYMGVLYFILAPGEYHQEARSYMAVTILMLGFAFYPVIVDRGNPAARVLALGGLLLLVSDSLRAYLFFRMGFYAGTFLTDNLMEVLIVGLFFAGHFCVIQVMKPPAADQLS